MVTEDQVREALREIYDPEIGMNVVDLGLIYGVDIRDGDKVRVQMTMTTPMCPAAQYILVGAQRAIEDVKGVQEAEIELVWDPPWSPEMMSEEAKLELGFGGL